MRRLTEKQRLCLEQIQRCSAAQDQAPTAAEVSRLAQHAGYWAWPALKALEAMGLAHEGRERRWMLTSAGRAALAQLMEKADG